MTRKKRADVAVEVGRLMHYLFPAPRDRSDLDLQAVLQLYAQENPSDYIRPICSWRGRGRCFGQFDRGGTPATISRQQSCNIARASVRRYYQQWSAIDRGERAAGPLLLQLAQAKAERSRQQKEKVVIRSKSSQASDGDPGW